MKQSLFSSVGGLETLKHVHRVFYDKVYAHPWLKQFFKDHAQDIIEDRQTSFMAEKMGGQIEYMGKPLKMAHRHMYITEELFNLRKILLKESLQECRVADPLIERWLKIDSAFFKAITKESVESFYKTTWKYEKRVIIPKPPAVPNSNLPANLPGHPG